MRCLNPIGASPPWASIGFLVGEVDPMLEPDDLLAEWVEVDLTVKRGQLRAGRRCDAPVGEEHLVR